MKLDWHLVRRVPPLRTAPEVPDRRLSSSSSRLSISLFAGYTSALSQTIKMNDESLASAGTPGIESDLLDPYERLVSIDVLGKQVEVPEKNRLLRCFQYLSLKTISYGDFCWNGECTNCQVWYHMDGQTEDLDRPALACRIEVAERMVITRISHFIELEGISK